MTAPAALADDRSYLTDGRPYLNARQAAVYCGYEPTPGRPAGQDPQMKRFYGWAALRGLHPQPGRSVYRRAELDAAIARRPLAPSADLEAMRRLAKSDAADSQRRMRFAVKRAATEE